MRSGAVSVTGGLALLVYAISKAPDVGWGTTRTIGLLLAAVLILAFFVVWELRATAPLVPFGIFRIRTLTGANIVGLLLGAMIYANFFILTLYVQQVLGWSALKTGLTFLATAGTTAIWAGVAQALVTKIGVRAVMTVGMGVLALTVLGYTRLPVRRSLLARSAAALSRLCPRAGVRIHPGHDRAFIGVPPHQAGLASGLLNTSQQIGGAVGVAITSTIFVSQAKAGNFTPEAFTSGYHWAFAALAAFAAAGAILAFVFFRGVHVPAPEGERAPVSA